MGREMPSPRELGINIPEGADKAIMHALSMKPEDRYVSIRSFEEDIEHAAADLKKSFDLTPPQVQMAPQYIAQSWMVPGVQMSPQVPVPNYPVGMQSQIPQQVSFQRPVLPSYPPMQYIPSPGIQDSQMLTIQTPEPGFFEWTFRHFKKKLRKALRKMRSGAGSKTV